MNPAYLVKSLIIKHRIREFQYMSICRQRISQLICLKIKFTESEGNLYEIITHGVLCYHFFKYTHCLIFSSLFREDIAQYIVNSVYTLYMGILFYQHIQLID